MRIILILISFFPLFVFAACPNGSVTSNQTSESIAAAITASGFPKDRLTTQKHGTTKQFKNGQYVDVDLIEACIQLVPVTCQPGFTKTPGLYGVNYHCEPPPCPSTHPTPFASSTGNQCKDSNGCNEDQSFVGGICVNKKVEDITARCMAAAGQGNVATITVPSDGSGPTCSIGGPIVDFGTVPACTMAPGGTACVVSQLASGDKSGMQCGTFNGAAVCVASSETNAIGTSSKTPGSSTTNGTPKSIEEQVSELGETTKIIKETTPQTTTTTTVNDGSPLKEGQQMDGGAGSSPMPQYTCSNGQFAANLQSCDTTVVCGSDSYIAYGVCIKLPTRTTVTAKDVTVTTTTKINDSTGQTVSQTSSTSSVSTPVKNPSAPGTAETQRTGQCDPTAKNYQECVGLLTSATDTKSDELKNALKTEGDTVLTTAYDSVKTSVQGTSNGLSVTTSGINGLINTFIFQPVTCQPMTITIGPITKAITCERFNFLKTAFAWALYAFTCFYLYSLFFKPVEK